MAVAVKTTTETTQQPLNRLAVGSLLGTAYVLVAFGILYALPQAWQTVVASLLPEALDKFGNITLLLLAMLAVAAGLAYLGVALAGSNPPRGLRAGIFCGVVGFLILVLIAAGIGRLLESSSGLAMGAGLATTAVIGVGLLIAGSLAFFRPGFERWLVRVEEQGWFSAAAYKRSQGQRVRRGTIIGILILAGCGDYTLLSHHSLGTGSGDWGFRLPFVYMTRLESVNKASKESVQENLQEVGHWSPDQAASLVNKLPQTVGSFLSRSDAEALGEALRKAGAKEKEVSIQPQLFVLLPHVKFTVPLLFAAVALWFAFRIVNLPVFADFLIATEAELNKVSWTTRKRLVQDTVVVLTTMLLLTGFLFAMDSLWIYVLKWPWINVLQTETGDTSYLDTQIEEKTKEKQAAEAKGEMEKAKNLQAEIDDLTRERENRRRGKQGDVLDW